jgi:GNAT superfamily N-acetyltransferase
MSNPYEIVQYRPEHKGQVAAFQTYLWTHNAGLATRYLEWKYEENPYVEPLIYLAFHGSELVGMRGFYGAKWELGQPREVHTVLVADDFVIAPQHRDRGLATLIMKAAFEDLAKRGYRHVFNLSGGQVTVLGSLAMGWKSAGPLKPVGLETGPTRDRRVQDFLKHHPLSSGRAGSPLPDSADEGQPFARFDRLARLRANGSVVLELEPRPDAMSALVSRLGHDGRIRHIRDREYFAWRFRNPWSIYRFLYLGDSGLDGYLVLKCPHPEALERQRVNIVDLEADAANHAAGGRYRSGTIRRTLRLGCDIYQWRSGIPFRQRLQAGRPRVASARLSRGAGEAACAGIHRSRLDARRSPPDGSGRLGHAHALHHGRLAFRAAGDGLDGLPVQP